jgi:hypothetical protein
MTIKIIRTTTEILNEEDKKVESVYTTESYVITPEKNKILKNINTDRLLRASACVNKKSKIAEYVEIDDPYTLLEDPNAEK